MDSSAELRDLTAATWEAAAGHRFVDELWERGEFDRVGAGNTAHAAFVRAVELELAFFDQVYG